jgi:hypothetical protein
VGASDRDRISRLSWFRRIPDHHQRAKAQCDKVEDVWQHK